MKKHLISLSIGLAFIVAVLLGIKAQVADANPTFFLPPTVTSALGTSTESLIVPGTATSTLTFDSNASGRPYAADTATLLLQATASSTSSVININFQYSNNGIDWYGDSLQTPTATTTTQINLTNSYTWAVGTIATSGRAIIMPTPTRYVRAVMSAVTANSSVYATILPKQQSL